jgi:hypothetical protein
LAICVLFLHVNCSFTLDIEVNPLIGEIEDCFDFIGESLALLRDY